MKNEKWKRLKEDKNYLISSWGRIFSLKSEVIMRPYLHKSRANTYLRVGLNKKQYMVHVLVGMNFKRKEFELLKEIFPHCIIQFNHDDRNTFNCNANNITPMTEADNKNHLSETNIIYFNGKMYKGKLSKGKK